MREQEEDNVIPDQGEPVDGTIDLAKELFDKFKSVEKHIGHGIKYNYPDGSFTRLELSAYDDFPNHRGPKPYRLLLWISYIPNDEKPIIPNDMLSSGVKMVVDIIFDKIPEIKEYSKDILNEFTFDVTNETIYFKEGIIHLTNPEILPSNESNVILAKYSLVDMVDNPESFINTYYLENPPRFSEDYSLAMDKIIKRVNTIYKAYSTGKWRGMTYTFPTKPTITIHQRFKRYNKEDRILYPEFAASISTGWPKVGDKYLKSIEDEETYKEFMDFLTKRFKTFNIHFS